MSTCDKNESYSCSGNYLCPAILTLKFVCIPYVAGDSISKSATAKCPPAHSPENLLLITQGKSSEYAATTKQDKAHHTRNFNCKWDESNAIQEWGIPPCP